MDIYYLNKQTKGKLSANFLEVSTKEKLFIPDVNFVNRINNPKNGHLWKATIYPDFVGKSYSEMRGLLGNLKGGHSFKEINTDIDTQNTSNDISEFDNDESNNDSSFLEIKLEVI